MADIKLTITGNSRSAQSAIDAVNKSIDQMDAAIGSIDPGQLDSVTIAAESTKGGFSIGAAAATALGTAIVDAAKAGIQWLKDTGAAALDAASELEQAQGGVLAVFKDMSGTITESAQQAANAVGLSEAAYSNLAVVIGANFKNAGMAGQELTQNVQGVINIGADLAAQFGGTTQQAVEALSSAFRGEYDPIERYGISLKASAISAELAARGLSDLEGDQLRAAQTTIALEMIQRQSADAMGAFAREANTAAGAQQRANAQAENARAALGEALLPASIAVSEVMAELSTRVSDFMKSAEGQKVIEFMADSFEALGDAAMGAIEWLGENSDEIGEFLSIVADVAPAVLGAVAAFAAFKGTTAVIDGVKTAVLGVNGAMKANPIGIIVTLIGAAVGLIIANWDSIRPVVEKVWNAIKDAAQVVADWFNTYVMPIIRAIGDVFQWIWDTIIKPVFNAWISVIETVIGWFGKIRDWFSEFGDTIKNAIDVVFVQPFQWVVDKLSAVWDWVQSVARAIKSIVIPSWMTSTVSKTTIEASVAHTWTPRTVGSMVTYSGAMIDAAALGTASPTVTIDAGRATIPTARQDITINVRVDGLVTDPTRTGQQIAEALDRYLRSRGKVTL
jgi:hypothetical protein